MRYAVVYQSKSGNTEMLANEIYGCIDSDDKILCDIDKNGDIPEADLYFIGFGIHNGTCGLEIADVLEKISDAKYALFITCGFVPSEKYREKLLKNLQVWLPDEAEYIDTFLCQGKMEKHMREVMISKMPYQENELNEMFEIGESHPNSTDIEGVNTFAYNILQAFED